MCEGGINTGQMKLAIAMVNDSLALSQQWLEQLHHLADQGRRTITSTELAQVTVLLGEAREKLDVAAEQMRIGEDDVRVERL
jgi:hypothetical protein